MGRVAAVSMIAVAAAPMGGVYAQDPGFERNPGVGGDGVVYNDSAVGGAVKRFSIGPIPGLTTQWHVAPEKASVPLGFTIQFRQPAPVGATVTWFGAEETSRNGQWSIAECPLNVEGSNVVRVVVERGGQGPTEYAMVLKVTDIDPADIFVGAIEATVAPFDLNEDSGNDETMRYFFGESVAALRDLGNGAYRTSTDKTVRLSATVDPPGFAPLLEWRADDRVIALGGLTPVRFDAPGAHSIHAGPTEGGSSISIETYRVIIKSHQQGVDMVPDGEPVTFTAETDPPEHEDEITWLSSTKYGTAKPVLGYGPVFVTTFNNTWGPNPEWGDWQWLGVRADGAMLNQDRKLCKEVCELHDLAKRIERLICEFLRRFEEMDPKEKLEAACEALDEARALAGQARAKRELACRTGGDEFACSLARLAESQAEIGVTLALLAKEEAQRQVLQLRRLREMKLLACQITGLTQQLKNRICKECECPPGPEEAMWDGWPAKPKNNCYNYATNQKTCTFAQPGRGTGRQYPRITCDEVKAAAVRDGLKAVDGPDGCGENECLVALVVSPGNDYHWYRRNRDGSWSHKPGGTCVTDRDSAGRRITDPRTAERKVYKRNGQLDFEYTEFCGFMCVAWANLKVIQDEEPGPGPSPGGDGEYIEASALCYSGIESPSWSIDDPNTIQTILMMIESGIPTSPPDWGGELGYGGLHLSGQNYSDFPELVRAFRGVIEISNGEEREFLEDVAGLEDYLVQLARDQGITDCIED
jgi:hypothetical protein